MTDQQIATLRSAIEAADDPEKSLTQAWAQMRSVLPDAGWNTARLVLCMVETAL